MTEMRLGPDILVMERLPHGQINMDLDHFLSIVTSPIFCYREKRLSMAIYNKGTSGVENLSIPRAARQ